MSLSTDLYMNQGPAGADTSSSNNRSANCLRQLECSTGMKEGVSDHKTSPTPAPSTPPYPINILLGSPPHPQVLILKNELTGQSRQMARSCLVVKTQQVLYCQKPLHTSSPSHITAAIGPLQAPATLSVGGNRGTLQGLLGYQYMPALKCAGPKSGLCLLEGISLVVCVGLR